MQILLLAAGQSSRMSPLSDKALLKICGKPIIEHQIDNIISAGFKDFLIICNSENIEKIKEIGKTKKGISFIYIIQKNIKDGMKGAIESCENKIKNSVFVISSNDIVEKDIFIKMFKESQKNKFFALICGKVVEKYFPGGYISKDKNGFLKDIIEKPGEGKEPSNQINLVLHIWNDFKVFKNKMFDFHNSTDNAYEKTIQFFCKDKKIKVVEYNGFWQAVKYPWHINILTNYFLNNQKYNIDKSVIISNNITIKGDSVVIKKGVKIFENSVIQGPVYIGENTIIGNNTLIRQSSIGNNSVIGFGTEVCRSCLQDNIWTHTNYIGDSVIDDNVSFGAGTTTGNLRLDEEEILVKIKGEKIKTNSNKIGSFIGKNCRLGINISINPGVKIGENSLIGGGIILTEDILKNSFIYGTSVIIKKENLKNIGKRK